jgi:hypothetical protein
MGPHLMKGDFHLPAPGKPEQDLDGIGLLVGAEQGLGRKLARGIADEHPPERMSTGTNPVWYQRASPETYSRRRSPYQRAVPAGKCHHCPDRRRIGAHLVQGRQALPDDAGTPVLAWETRRRWSVQTRIAAYAGNAGRDGPHCIEQIEGGVASVANDDQRAVREPE